MQEASDTKNAQSEERSKLLQEHASLVDKMTKDLEATNDPKP